ncbi:hypothetical protein ACSBR1_011859 [Camellia fascicularis]
MNEVEEDEIQLLFYRWEKINSIRLKELTEAYEVLSDPKKREIYDQYGEDALKIDPFDNFESFFGGGSGSSSDHRGEDVNHPSRDHRGEDVIHPLKVSLEDLYNGTAKKLSLSHNVICSKCKGKGSKSSMKCAGCQGFGMKVSIRHLGPNMIQQMQHPCNECKGTGETINDKDPCPQCKGDKVVKEKKVLEVVVEKGMQNGQRIIFPEEADAVPDMITGDIVFVLQQEVHPKFKRKGDDIFVEHPLTLTKAFCGFQFIITHLDNRQLLIKSQPGEVVKRVVLPPKPSMQMSEMELDECEETTLHDVNIEEEMRWKQQQAQEAYHEDEDMHSGGAQRVQCVQQ